MVTDRSGVPHCIIECKKDKGTVKDVLAQSISYGLTLRVHCKLPYELLLVIVTPTFWGFAYLPPYGTKIKTPVDYEGFTTLQVIDGKSYLSKNSYLLCLDRLAKHILSIPAPKETKVIRNIKI